MQTHSTGRPCGPGAMITLLVQSAEGRGRPVTRRASTPTIKISPAIANQKIFTASSEGPEEGHEVRLLGRGQLGAQGQVEELHRVVEGQEPAVVQIGRRVLDAAKRERLDRPVAERPPA